MGELEAFRTIRPAVPCQNRMGWVVRMPQMQCKRCMMKQICIITQICKLWDNWFNLCGIQMYAHRPSSWGVKGRCPKLKASNHHKNEVEVYLWEYKGPKPSSRSRCDHNSIAAHNLCWSNQGLILLTVSLVSFNKSGHWTRKKHH